MSLVTAQAAQAVASAEEAAQAAVEVAVAALAAAATGQAASLASAAAQAAASAKEALAFMEDADRVLGVLKRKKKREIPAEARELVDAREAARRKGDYVEADRIRALLRGKGIVIEDSKEGVRVKWLD